MQNRCHAPYVYCMEDGAIRQDRFSFLNQYIMQSDSCRYNENFIGLNVSYNHYINPYIPKQESRCHTLNDEKIRRAIADFHAKFLVIDPVQAYIGEADMGNATGMRKILRQLAGWAALYDCAIILVGHLNKRQGSKDLYRGLGSIDLVAAARSVLQVERMPEDDSIVIVHQVKSSLAPKGSDQFFVKDPKGGIEEQNCEEGEPPVQ